MTAGVRNGVLARATATAAGSLLLATVPANETWLLKSAVLTNSSSAAIDVLVSLRAAVTGTSAYLIQLALEANKGEVWEHWVACNTGDQLYLSTDAGPATVWISGAALPGVVTAQIARSVERPAPV